MFNKLFEFISDVQMGTNFTIGDRFILVIANQNSEIENLPKIRFDYSILQSYGENTFQIGIPNNKTRNEFKVEMSLYYKDSVYIFDIGETIDLNKQPELITDLGSDFVECYLLRNDEIYKSKNPNYFIITRKVNGQHADAYRQTKPINIKYISKIKNDYLIKVSILDKIIDYRRISEYCPSASIELIDKKTFYSNLLSK